MAVPNTNPGGNGSPGPASSPEATSAPASAAAPASGTLSAPFARESPPQPHPVAMTARSSEAERRPSCIGASLTSETDGAPQLHAHGGCPRGGKRRPPLRRVTPHLHFLLLKDTLQPVL